MLGSSARRPTPDRPMVSPGSVSDHARADAVEPADQPAAPPTAQPTGLSVPDAWDRSLKSSITPLMVRALFAAGTFVGGSGERWKFDLPSTAHATRCEPHRSTIEAQLAELVGHPVHLEFVTGSARDADRGSESGNDDGRHVGAEQRARVQEQPSADTSVARSAVDDRPNTPSKPAMERARAAAAAVTEEEVAAVADEPVFEADDEIDLSDLTDAPPESVRTPLDHLTEAFPGSQFITDD